jgi:hypothetical protein
LLESLDSRRRVGVERECGALHDDPALCYPQKRFVVVDVAEHWFRAEFA